MPDYNAMPSPNLRPGLQLYIERGIQPGDFLTAVICNNLKEAFARADCQNQDLMLQIVAWMYNESPALCWGSPYRMRRWMKKFGTTPRPLPQFPGMEEVIDA